MLRKCCSQRSSKDFYVFRLDGFKNKFPKLEIDRNGTTCRVCNTKVSFSDIFNQWEQCSDSNNNYCPNCIIKYDLM